MSRFEDKSTIRAIDRLREEYPYAAALLCYTVVERVLKTRLIQEWESPELMMVHLPGKSTLRENSGKRLKELTCPNRDDFFDSVVRKLTLGDLEAMFPNHARNIAKDRNDLVHSNLYLRDEVGTDTTNTDRKRYEMALEHLRYTIEMHTSFCVSIAKDGRLTLRKERDAATT